jgi:hypothetical protein
MQRLEVSVAVRHIYFIRRLKVNTKVKAVRCVETSGTSYVTTQCHIPAHLNTQSVFLCYINFHIIMFSIPFSCVPFMYLLFIDTVVSLILFSIPSSCSALFYNCLRKYLSPPALTGLPIKNISLAIERTLTISVNDDTRVCLIVV